MKWTKEEASAFVASRLNASRSIKESMHDLHDAVRASLIESTKISSSDSSTEPSCAIPDVFSAAKDHSSSRLSELAKTGALVRCRGMIQDIHAERTMIQSFSHIFFSFLGEESDEEGRAEELCYVETLMLRVIPVPGNTTFYEASDGIEKCCFSSITANAAEWNPLNESSPLSSSTGDHVLLPSSSYEDKLNSLRLQGDTSDSLREKKQMNFPQPCTHPKLRASCIVTVLAPQEQAGSDTNAAPSKSTYQMNDVCEFYGFLVPEQQGAPVGEGGVYVDKPVRFDDMDDELESEIWHPEEVYRKAGATISQLIAVSSMPLTSANSYNPPILPARHAHARKTDETHSLGPAHSLSGSFWFEQRRAQAVQFLATQLCGGSALAAEYLLLHLCSHVVAHHTATPVGDVPLLVLFPPSMEEPWSSIPPRWTAILRSIVPVAAIMLDSTTLCTDTSMAAHAGKKRSNEMLEEPTPFAPQYDANGNYLNAGSLQLANGSNVILNAKDLLNESNEARNPIIHETSAGYETLFSLVHQALLPIDYPYHRVELPVSLSVLALAPREEKLPEMFQFPLAISLATLPSAETMCSAMPEEKGAYPIPKQFTIEDIQHYISAVRQQCTTNYAERGELFSESLQESMAGALTRLSHELASWHNHHSLLHNNTFSAVSSLIAVEAASRGRRGIAHEDIDHVVFLERQRVSSLVK